MKFLLCAILFGLALATITDTQDITLDGPAYTGDDTTSWLNDCTTAVQAAGCANCVCTEVSFDDDVVITVSGDEQDLDKLDDHVEDDGITISGEDYSYVEEEEDGTMTLVVTMTIFVLMCICGIAFFACMPWPNTPEKIAERERLRREEEKANKAAEQAKATQKATIANASKYEY